MDKKDYLDIAKASDLKDKKTRLLYRFLETLPGLMSLGTLLVVLVFSWLFPSWIAIFIICFCFYYLLRVLYFSMHQIFSYFKIKSHLKKDWLKELKTIPARNTSPARQLDSSHGGGHSDADGKHRDWKKIYHVVILPTYKEGNKIIRESIDALLTSEYPKERLIVVLATESRAGKEFDVMAKKIETDYKGRFFKFLVTHHPADVVGELAGKGSNVAFAGKQVKALIDDLKISYENILISSFDVDTKVYKHYFSCLTWYYLNEENPEMASYQPIPVYNNNIWKAPFFTRVVATSNTFWQMIQQERSEKLTTYSSHAIPASVFFNVGYPSNVVQDDSRIFWKAYLYFDGNYKVVPMYYLVSMDAVHSPKFLRTVVNQYQQQKRWAWGVAEIPYITFGFLHNKKISFLSKVSHLYTIVDGYWSWATAALLLLMLGWLPIFLGGEKFNFTVLSFNLPILTGRIMTVALLGMLISAILSALLLPPLPKGVKYTRKIAVLLQWLFLPVTLIVFGAFPALDAQIRLMLGKYMGFWVTEKIRK